LRKYDALLILPVALDDDAIDKALERLRNEIVKLEGTVSDAKPMGRRAFARPLKKKEAGVYVTMAFELDPSRIDALIARLKLNEDLFRLQILRHEEFVAMPTGEPAGGGEAFADRKEGDAKS
jgi:small subunit ribosomal protein S6